MIRKRSVNGFLAQDITLLYSMLTSIENEINLRQRGKNKRLYQIMTLAQEYCKTLAPVDTGQLQDSINIKYLTEKRRYKDFLLGAELRVEGPAKHYAKYVEYGTGIVGDANPHPNPPKKWIYDENEHGEEGWLYYKPKLKMARWTLGQEGAAFMYKTYLYLRNIIESNPVNAKWYTIRFKTEKVSPYILITKNPRRR